MEDYYLDGGIVGIEEDESAQLTAPQPTPPPQPTPTAPPPPRSTGQPLYFDLETVPDVERVATFDLPPLPEIPPEQLDAKALPDPQELSGEAIGRIRDVLDKQLCPLLWLDQLADAERHGKSRKGVHDAIDKAKKANSAAANALEDRIKLLSTTPEYCSICAMAFAAGNGEVESIVVGEEDGGKKVTERLILEGFWHIAQAYSPLVGFNIIGFDLPVIMVRSIILGVPATRPFDFKPWGKDIVDCYLGRFGARGNTDSKRPGTLKKLAACYGIDVPEEGVDGSQVFGLMQDGEFEKVGRYVASDVLVVRELHRRLSGYFWT